MPATEATGEFIYPSAGDGELCDKDVRSPTRVDDRGSASSVSVNPSLLDRRYLIRRPRALQYFENGVLKKAQNKERVSGRFELFFDLLYVALIANFAEKLADDPSGVNLVLFLLTFTAAWSVLFYIQNLFSHILSLHCPALTESKARVGRRKGECEQLSQR